MSQRSNQAPTDWDAYARGRTASTGSLNSIMEDETQQEYTSTGSSPILVRRIGHSEDGEDGSRERRSSMFLDSLRHMGGVNNIDNFARSFQRAAGFREITPVRRGSMSFGDEEDGNSPRRPRLSISPKAQGQSLIRQQLEHAQRQTPEVAVSETPTDSNIPRPSDAVEHTPLLSTPSHSRLRSRSSRSHGWTDGGSVLGTSYGSISSRLTTGAQHRASILIQQQHEANLRALADPNEYKEDLSGREIEVETRGDGETIERIVGESTVPMTIFNSTNVLIGVGILALPLGMKYAGWVIGLVFLTLAALTTNYTAQLLARCLDTNSASTTYGDLAFLAFDQWGRGVVEILFVIELLAANVALVILFGDSMNLLIPAISTLSWKAVITIGLLPLNFVPFRTLSVTSVLGIGCCLGIILIVFVDGLIKPHAPGSLRELAVTYAFPADWRTVPLSFGLFMAPWGGHSVFPAIYKDMRHPKKYGKALTTTYVFTYGLDMTLAVLGYLMFGEGVRDEITSNILKWPGYPRALSVVIVLLIAIIPITKIPLSNRPIQDTMNKKFYIDLRQMDAKTRQYSEQSWKHRCARGTIAILCNVVELGIAILLPDFDSVMALLGSAFCFSICIIGPVAFYLRIFSADGDGISTRERIFGWFLIVLCTALAITGTVFAILPKERLGASVCDGLLLCMRS